MRSLFCAASASGPAPLRIVWLPGANNGAQDFLDAGFATAVAKRGLALDLVFVDLELQHVQDRSVLHALRSGMVRPPHESGISVWLGGISLGGLLALDFAAADDSEISGLCLLAPYLGNRMLTAEIERASGVARWEPGEFAQHDEERRIWRYIKNRGPGAVPLHLGFGVNDRFSASHRLMAQALAPDAVDTVEGGHDWSTWTNLWENFLEMHFA